MVMSVTSGACFLAMAASIFFSMAGNSVTVKMESLRRPQRTTAVRKGDGWVLNGTKNFITNAPAADLMLVAAMTAPGQGARGISVSLGSDGAACNNRLDMFEEMRLAATLQAVRTRPGLLTARDVVWMATREGARALGLEREIGSIEPGKRADLTLIERDRPHLAPDADPWSTLVYAARGTDVRLTMVDGSIRVKDFALTDEDVTAITAAARAAAVVLSSRARVPNAASV